MAAPVNPRAPGPRAWPRPGRLRLALLLAGALGAAGALRADPAGDFLDLVVKQARAGDRDALRWETYGRKVAPELTDVQCGELAMLFSGYEVTRRTVTPFARWKPEVEGMAFNGRPTTYVEAPDAVAQFHIRSLVVGPTGRASEGTIVLPIAFRAGKYWIMATRYKDPPAPGPR
jgi:hypothetical protein